MTSPRRPGPFDHGEFWDQYSQSWAEQFAAQDSIEILGEEWASPDRTRFLFERFAQPYLHSSAQVVEIGPGGGKFSRRLVEHCHELSLVDISHEMLQRANRACGGRARALKIEDGSLAAIEPASVDLVFSYDVFIHLESEEVFRYLAEVNRILKPGGIFSVHTSNFESRWGLHSYFQQLRDRQPMIGSRYGGRVYPMTDAILRRFAEHTGFAVADSFTSRIDRDIIYALRKARPARPWSFITQPDLYQRFELSERVGGSDRRELYTALSLESGAELLLVLGDAEDGVLQAIAHAAIPEHPCLPAPQGLETHAGIAMVSFPPVHGLCLSRLLAADSPGLPAQLGRLFEGLLQAHGAGLVHGELGDDFIVHGDATGALRLVGIHEPEAPRADALRAQDLAAAGRILGAVASTTSADVAEIAAELAQRPRKELLEHGVQTLLHRTD